MEPELSMNALLGINFGCMKETLTIPVLKKKVSPLHIFSKFVR